MSDAVTHAMTLPPPDGRFDGYPKRLFHPATLNVFDKASPPAPLSVGCAGQEEMLREKEIQKGLDEYSKAEAAILREMNRVKGPPGFRDY